MKRPLAVVCDLDGTLALSKSPVQADIAIAMRRLVDERSTRFAIAIVSGCSWAQMRCQLLPALKAQFLYSALQQLHLFPTSGAAHFRFLPPSGDWAPLYMHGLSEREVRLIEQAFFAATAGWSLPPPHGPRLETRGAQVTFSALGQAAPLPEKLAWDPDGALRGPIVQELRERLGPEFEVRAGGATSIDVTRCGVNKAYAIREFSAATGVKLVDMVYFGDSWGPLGNDEVVRLTGIECVPVRGPDDTRARLEELARAR